MSSANTVNDLPAEILLKIFNSTKFSLLDLLNLSKISVKFNNILHNSEVYKKFLNPNISLKDITYDMLQKALNECDYNLLTMDTLVKSYHPLKAESIKYLYNNREILLTKFTAESYKNLNLAQIKILAANPEELLEDKYTPEFYITQEVSKIQMLINTEQLLVNRHILESYKNLNSDKTPMVLKHKLVLLEGEYTPESFAALNRAQIEVLAENPIELLHGKYPPASFKNVDADKMKMLVKYHKELSAFSPQSYIKLPLQIIEILGKNSKELFKEGVTPEFYTDFDPNKINALAKYSEQIWTKDVPLEYIKSILLTWNFSTIKALGQNATILLNGRNVTFYFGWSEKNILDLVDILKDDPSQSLQDWTLLKIHAYEADNTKTPPIPTSQASHFDFSNMDANTDDFEPITPPPLPLLIGEVDFHLADNAC